VGVAYGRIKLPWNRKKSLEGTLAGAIAGFLAGVVMASIPYAYTGHLVPPALYAVVMAGALAGALAETAPKVEDNFVVPLASAAVMYVMAGALQLPLP
jgi:dolichol kinase